MKTLNDIRYYLIRLFNRRKLVGITLDQASTVKRGDVISVAYTDGEKSLISVGRERFLPRKSPTVKVQGSFALRDILL